MTVPALFAGNQISVLKVIIILANSLLSQLLYICREPLQWLLHRVNGVGGPGVPPDQLSPRTLGPRTGCPPGLVVLGPDVPRQDRMSPHHI